METLERIGEVIGNLMLAHIVASTIILAVLNVAIFTHAGIRLYRIGKR